MNNTVGKIGYAIVGLVALVVGMTQITSGIEQITDDGMPTIAQAQYVARGDLVTFVSESRGISLHYPVDWFAEEPAAGPMFFVFKTFSGRVNVNVAAERLVSGTVLANYVQSNFEQIESMLTEQNMSPRFLERKRIDVGGQPATRLVFSYTPPDFEQDTTASQVLVINNDHAYAITLTTPSELHGEFDNMMEQILSSVRFL